MINPSPVRLCFIFLTLLPIVPSSFAQTPVPAPAQTPASPPVLIPIAPPPQPPNPNGSLIIGILEGDNAVNSLPLLQTVSPVIQVLDKNSFPLEGATVVFTLPDNGPGGTFAGGGASFTTRSDSRGQAGAAVIIPRQTGKFQIKVVATLGNRRGEAAITQTNSTQATIHTGAEPPPSVRWYKRKLVWIAAGGAVVTVAVILATRHSSSSSNTITVTAGPPIFQ